ncbi:hypothetical protein [Streptomyces sp. NBC_01197]|uniref:hypothetical protein n=1 Tax=Streptomyces sp. NBC_01197 TaxID=2903768 RepID=UPI002E15A0A2|nr:hypothetical protein OG452_05195 [Streptomyces sp. NBC_01197]
MEIQLSMLLFGSDYKASVVFGGESDLTYLRFGTPDFMDFEHNFSAEDLDTFISMLSYARSSKKENA